jgi:hypothetical protein
LGSQPFKAASSRQALPTPSLASSPMTTGTSLDRFSLTSSLSAPHATLLETASASSCLARTCCLSQVRNTARVLRLECCTRVHLMLQLQSSCTVPWQGTQYVSPVHLTHAFGSPAQTDSLLLHHLASEYIDLLSGLQCKKDETCNSPRPELIHKLYYVHVCVQTCVCVCVCVQTCQRAESTHALCGGTSQVAWH